MPRKAKAEAEKTRARIMASALALFAKKGYERTTFTDIAARLKRAGAADVLMTGSGATVFATAESPAAAAALAAALPAGCWRAVTRTAPGQVAE